MIVETITAITTYLSEHQVILIGASTTIAEITVIVVNCYRKLKSDKSKTTTMGLKGSKSVKPTSVLRVLLWSANPINLFRAV